MAKQKADIDKEGSVFDENTENDTNNVNNLNDSIYYNDIFYYIEAFKFLMESTNHAKLANNSSSFPSTHNQFNISKNQDDFIAKDEKKSFVVEGPGAKTATALAVEASITSNDLIGQLLDLIAQDVDIPIVREAFDLAGLSDHFFSDTHNIKTYLNEALIDAVGRFNYIDPAQVDYGQLVTGQIKLSNLSENLASAISASNQAFQQNQIAIADGFANAALDSVHNTIATLDGLLIDITNLGFDTLHTILSEVRDKATDTVQDLSNSLNVTDQFDSVTSDLFGLHDTLDSLDNELDKLLDKLGGIGDILKDLIKEIKSDIKDVENEISGVIDQIANLTNVATGALDNLIGAIQNSSNLILDLNHAMGNFIQEVNTLLSPFQTFTNLLDDFLGAQDTFVALQSDLLKEIQILQSIELGQIYDANGNFIGDNYQLANEIVSFVAGEIGSIAGNVIDNNKVQLDEVHHFADVSHLQVNHTYADTDAPIAGGNGNDIIAGDAGSFDLAVAAGNANQGVAVNANTDIAQDSIAGEAAIQVDSDFSTIFDAVSQIVFGSEPEISGGNGADSLHGDTITTQFTMTASNNSQGASVQAGTYGTAISNTNTSLYYLNSTEMPLIKYGNDGKIIGGNGGDQLFGDSQAVHMAFLGGSGSVGGNASVSGNHDAYAQTNFENTLEVNGHLMQFGADSLLNGGNSGKGGNTVSLYAGDAQSFHLLVEGGNEVNGGKLMASGATFIDFQDALHDAIKENIKADLKAYQPFNTTIDPESYGLNPTPPLMQLNAALSEQLGDQISSLLAKQLSASVSEVIFEQSNFKADALANVENKIDELINLSDIENLIQDQLHIARELESTMNDFVSSVIAVLDNAINQVLHQNDSVNEIMHILLTELDVQVNEMIQNLIPGSINPALQLSNTIESILAPILPDLSGIDLPFVQINSVFETLENFANTLENLTTDALDLINPVNTVEAVAQEFINEAFEFMQTLNEKLNPLNTLAGDTADRIDFIEAMQTEFEQVFDFNAMGDFLENSITEAVLPVISDGLDAVMPDNTLSSLLDTSVIYNGVINFGDDPLLIGANGPDHIYGDVEELQIGVNGGSQAHGGVVSINEPVEAGVLFGHSSVISELYTVGKIGEEAQINFGNDGHIYGGLSGDVLIGDAGNVKFNLSGGRDASSATVATGSQANTHILLDASSIYQGNGTDAFLQFGDEVLAGEGGPDLMSGDVHTFDFNLQGGINADNAIPDFEGSDLDPAEHDIALDAFARANDLIVQYGDDVLYGGAALDENNANKGGTNNGNDLMYGDAVSMNISVNGGTAQGDNTDVSASIDGMKVYFGDDILEAQAGVNTLYGDIGTIDIRLQDGSTDAVNPDTVNISASISNSVMYFGSDQVTGGTGNDKIIGDTLYYPQIEGLDYKWGDDTLTGGGGQNTFAFALTSSQGMQGNDVITDFQPGKDKLEFNNLVDMNGDGAVDVDDLTEITTLVQDPLNNQTVIEFSEGSLTLEELQLSEISELWDDTIII